MDRPRSGRARPQAARSTVLVSRIASAGSARPSPCEPSRRCGAADGSTRRGRPAETSAEDGGPSTRTPSTAPRSPAPASSKPTGNTLSSASSVRFCAGVTAAASTAMRLRGSRSSGSVVSIVMGGFAEPPGSMRILSGHRTRQRAHRRPVSIKRLPTIVPCVRHASRSRGPSLIIWMQAAHPSPTMPAQIPCLRLARRVPRAGGS